jgi:biopolymer transport protein ExbB
MIPIGLCSVVWLAFLFERLLVLRRRKVIPRELATAVAGLRRSPGLDGERLSVLLEAHPSAASSVLRAALERLHLPRVEIEHAVNTVGQRELYALRRNLRLFAIVASVAPLLGLLGTVTGLIQAFREVAVMGLGSGSSLAPGIYQALITTAGGLLVAIPSLLTYYWLMARVDHFAHEIDNLVVDFVDEHHTVGPAAGAPVARAVSRQEA